MEGRGRWVGSEPHRAPNVLHLVPSPQSINSPPQPMTSVSDIFDTLEYGPAPESDKEARAWMARFERGFSHFIDGEWREPSDRTRFDVDEPATGKPLAKVAQGSAKDVDAAV